MPERMGSMKKLDSLDVEFKTSMSKADNCICNACHGTGTVMKLTYPTTLYYDGKHLSTKYHEFWLCAKCRTKLSFALDWPDDTNERERKEGADNG